MNAQRLHQTVGASAIGFALGYALPSVAGVRNLFYDPIARRFFWATAPGPLPIGYFGQLLYAIILASMGGGITWLVTHFTNGKRGASRKNDAVLTAAWALTALLFVGAYFTWNNWP